MPDWKKLLKIGTGVGSVVAPGGVSRILDIVNKSIDDENDPGNAKANAALAQEVRDLTEAVIVLHSRLERAEKKLGLK